MHAYPPDKQASEASLAVTQHKAECTALLANAEGIAAPMVRIFTKKKQERFQPVIVRRREALSVLLCLQR